MFLRTHTHIYGNTKSRQLYKGTFYDLNRILLVGIRLMSLDLLCMAADPDSSSTFISHLQHRLAVKQAERCGALDNMIILFINLFYPQQSRDPTPPTPTHKAAGILARGRPSVEEGRECVCVGWGSVARHFYHLAVCKKVWGPPPSPQRPPTLVLSVHALLLNGGINITVKGAMHPRVHAHIIPWLWATPRTKDAKKGGHLKSYCSSRSFSPFSRPSSFLMTFDKFVQLYDFTVLLRH